ncbi:hypothetical protein T492DRAFT_833916 [Pavlovales sp. CCMP2436]|nr:hypothetical protein T492DRAFT_833916 [Pavlovales sp. CCMP2436]
MVKYSERLHANIVPGWSQHYMDYGMLKRRIKEVSEPTPLSANPAPAARYRLRTHSSFTRQQQAILLLRRHFYPILLHSYPIRAAPSSRDRPANIDGFEPANFRASAIAEADKRRASAGYRLRTQPYPLTCPYVPPQTLP